MTRFMRAFSIALIPFLFVACGGGDDGGGGANGVDLPGDDSRLVSELTPEEATALCMQSSEMTAAILGDSNIMCAAQGLSMEQAGVGDCDELFAECVADPENDMQSDPAEDCADVHEDIIDCTATVAELEGCLNEMNEGFEAFLAPYLDLSCDSDPAILQELQSMGEPPEPACLAEIEAKCPGFAGDDEDD